MVPWLRLYIPNAGAQVPSLVGELRSHAKCNGQKKKKSEEAPAFMLHGLYPGHTALLIGGLHPVPWLSFASLVP